MSKHENPCRPDPLGITFDDLVKSQHYHTDGLWKKFDIRGVVPYATIRQYIWYGELSRKAYNELDRAFYESITFKASQQCVVEGYPRELHHRFTFQLFEQISPVGINCMWADIELIGDFFTGFA